MIAEADKEVRGVGLEALPVIVEPKIETGQSFEDLKLSVFSRLLKSVPGMFELVESKVGVHNFDIFESAADNFSTLAGLRRFEKNSLKVFINLHCYNDFRYLNKYILEVRSKLKEGGIFIAWGKTLVADKNRFFDKYPKYLSYLLYGLHFCYARVMAKMPGLKKLYFMISRGENRAISKAEILGRLCFCGFKVLAEQEIDGVLCYIAKKDKRPVVNKAPSYGPLIKLRRIGANGETIFINKFRTMHPYSEYLQDYIYERNKLQSNGKFKDDFRITGWGKIFRKYWIDELPQLINLFKGDLNLFGVRALSEQYYKLYPRNLQKMRLAFKPGLIPPFYCDMPDSFEDILDSEFRYISSKHQKPFVTDLVYLTKALYNIFFKNARSR